MATFREILLPSSARWREKYLSKPSLIEHTCSWRVNLLHYEHWPDKQKYFLRPSKIFERVLHMCRVLNMSEFWIFVNFRKYDRVLNICYDITMKRFRIFQDSKYVRFLHMQALLKVLNMPEYGWMMPYGRVLNMCGQRFRES